MKLIGVCHLTHPPLFSLQDFAACAASAVGDSCQEVGSGQVVVEAVGGEERRVVEERAVGSIDVEACGRGEQYGVASARELKRRLARIESRRGDARIVHNLHGYVHGKAFSQLAARLGKRTPGIGIAEA